MRVTAAKFAPNGCARLEQMRTHGAGVHAGQLGHFCGIVLLQVHEIEHFTLLGWQFEKIRLHKLPKLRSVNAGTWIG